MCWGGCRNIGREEGDLLRDVFVEDGKLFSLETTDGLAVSVVRDHRELDEPGGDFNGGRLVCGIGFRVWRSLRRARSGKKQGQRGEQRC